MSPKTYIGPFGRVLPLQESEEPVDHILPCDETRTTMAYTLPPPQALEFGSDTSLVSTDPTKYQSISQSRSDTKPSETVFRDIERQAHHGHLPAFNKLLKPKAQPGETSPSPQQSPTEVPSSFQTPGDDRGYTIDHDSSSVHYSTYQTNYPYSQVPTQVIGGTHYEVKKMPLHNSRSTSHIPASFTVGQQESHIQQYAAYHVPISTYNPPSQQQSVQNAPQPQHMMSINSTQNQQVLPPNAPVQGFLEHRSNYDVAAHSNSGSDQSANTPANVVKPPVAKKVVGEMDVPGEGPSWIYEDGATCRKTIDGEPVNAEWGVTKAGKPRKRLAIACTTCREKKIKCDPAEPKCVQCEKFGRECRFTTALRNHHNTSKSPSYDSQAHTPSLKIKTEQSASRNILSSPSTSSSMETSGRSVLPSIPSLTSASSIEDTKAHNKKRRHSSPQISNANTFNIIRTSLNREPHPKRRRHDPTDPRTPKVDVEPANANIYETVGYSHPPSATWLRKAPASVEFHPVDWSDDPYEIDAKATSNIIYHATHIKLNRHGSGTEQMAIKTARKAKAATEHAQRLLQMLETTDKAFIKRSKLHSINSTEDCSLDFVFSTPFACYAILVAVDVLSALGTLEALQERLQSMQCGLRIVERQNSRWGHAKHCSSLIQKRIENLSKATDCKDIQSKKAWKCSEALDPSFGTEDIFYNKQTLAVNSLFEQVGITVAAKEIIMIGEALDPNDEQKPDIKHYSND